MLERRRAGPGERLERLETVQPEGLSPHLRGKIKTATDHPGANAITADSIRAEVAAFPEPTPHKSVLQRAVQICKRHRVIHFEAHDPSLAPISIIITTLLSRSYEFCVRHFSYGSAFDLLLDVIKRMPERIDQTPSAFSGHWVISNESTQGENFAEKWNSNPALASAFYAWHRQIVDDIEVLKATRGLDQIGKALGRTLGDRPVSKAMNAFTTRISTARGLGSLALVAAGLIPNAWSPNALGGTNAPPQKNTWTSVKDNTFFGT